MNTKGCFKKKWIQYNIKKMNTKGCYKKKWIQEGVIKNEYKKVL